MKTEDVAWVTRKANHDPDAGAYIYTRQGKWVADATTEQVADSIVRDHNCMLLCNKMNEDDHRVY
jgi:hypothetical protein